MKQACKKHKETLTSFLLAAQTRALGFSFVRGLVPVNMRQPGDESFTFTVQSILLPKFDFKTPDHVDVWELAKEWNGYLHEQLSKEKMPGGQLLRNALGISPEMVPHNPQLVCSYLNQVHLIVVHTCCCFFVTQQAFKCWRPRNEISYR